MVQIKFVLPLIETFVDFLPLPFGRAFGYAYLLSSHSLSLPYLCLTFGLPLAYLWFTFGLSFGELVDEDVCI